MPLDYVRFYEEQLDVKGLKKSQVPEFIKMETGYEISVEQAYEFLDPKRSAVPNAAMAAIWEAAFKVNLPPKYYGAANAYVQSKRK